MKPVLVIDVVGLTPRQIGERTPHLAALARRGAAAPMEAVFPAVTLSAQATFLTGLAPSGHGVVGNGWYFRELGEAWLWRQSSHLVAGEKLYERARALDPRCTTAQLFWWFALGARVDWMITPRPFYPADGRKIFAVQGAPPGFAEATEAELGPFPFHAFWGPRAGLESSRWIARATQRALVSQRPMLTLCYLPHLDYDQQRCGPRAPRALAALTDVDALVGELVRLADSLDVEIVVLSEYGIEAVERPVYVNRALREAGLLAVRESPVGEVLDPLACAAFAVADHQVAHVYARDAAAREAAREALSGLDGLAELLDEDGKRALGVAHPRAGDWVAVARPGAWFAYPWWLDDARAPDFARTVDIHRKPGYDPCELFVDPALAFPKLRVARRLLQKQLGLRYLMDVVSLDSTLVKGSHGRVPDDAQDGPVFLCSRPFADCGGEPADGLVDPRSVSARVLALLGRR
jgi:predicted AlkP superfamily pyrophosphatase or phosphodiesterase